MPGFLGSRAVKYGGNAVTAVAMMLGILAIVNFLSTRYSERIDTTEGDIYSLSDQTETLLDSLKKDVQMVAFYREPEQGRFENLVKEYAHLSKRISYRFVDPDKSPGEANRYGITAYGTTIIEVGGKEERITGSDERTLTNAIAKAIRDEEKVVYFLTGHGERPVDEDRESYGQVKKSLEEANYVVRDTLLLVRSQRVPDDCSLLIVSGPATQLLPAEVDSIRAYLEAGGAGLFLLDPGVQSGLEEMLKFWSVSVSNDFVVDGGGMGRLFGMDHSMPIVVQYGRHPVTQKHQGLMTGFILARSVSRTGSNVEGMDVVELAYTAERSWGESDLGPIKGQQAETISYDPTTDRIGPLSLAVAVTADPARPTLAEADRKTRLVVFGDSDFASNQYFTFQGNGDLFLNAVSWLMEEGELISIRPKERGHSPLQPLTRGDEQVLFWLSMVLIPGIPFVSGVIVWWRRR